MALLALKAFFLNCVDCFALLDKSAGNEQPTEHDLFVLERMISSWLAANPEVRSSAEAFRSFLNIAYSEEGKEQGLSPQFPRKDVEAVMQLVQDTHPKEWADLSQSFGLLPN